MNRLTEKSMKKKPELFVYKNFLFEIIKLPNLKMQFFYDCFKKIYVTEK